jgi:putative nucleotidyltransferase with HDIG domain
MAMLDESPFMGGNGDPRPPAPEAHHDTLRLVGDLAPMQRATDAPDLLARLAHSARQTIAADACLVSLLDDSGAVVRDVAGSASAAASLNAIAQEYTLRDFPLTEVVIQNGRSVEIAASDPSSDPAERDLLVTMGFARVLMVRIALEQKPIGIVEAYRCADVPFGLGASLQLEALCAFAANAYSRIELATRLELNYEKTIEGLVSALEARDPYTQSHTSRIRDLAMALAGSLQLPGEERRALRLGAILHDVGKIGVPDAILLKPGPLTDEEWDVMRAHPVVGERMLQGMDFLAPCLPIVRHHHERWDGTGYPDGLGDERIPRGARIVAVCDAFDAMTSDRPYRRALDTEAALKELHAKAGTQFDPTCAALLVDLVTALGDGQLEDRFVRYAG